MKMSYRKGAIEGLPLKIIVMVVIAAVGLGVLLAWLNSVNRSSSIGEVMPMGLWGSRKAITGITCDEPLSEEGSMTTNALLIKVYDNTGKPLGGVTISLEGCGALGAGVTGSDGCTIFNGEDPGNVMYGGSSGPVQTFTLAPGDESGEIIVKASKTDYGQKIVTIPFQRGSVDGLTGG